MHQKRAFSETDPKNVKSEVFKAMTVKKSRLLGCGAV
jgi:hypothetical protein